MWAIYQALVTRQARSGIFENKISSLETDARRSWVTGPGTTGITTGYRAVHPTLDLCQYPGVTWRRAVRVPEKDQPIVTRPWAPTTSWEFVMLSTEHLMPLTTSGFSEPAPELASSGFLRGGKGQANWSDTTRKCIFCGKMPQIHINEQWLTERNKQGIDLFSKHQK